MSSSALQIPELSLVLLVGVSGAGKSTFAQAHFAPFEIVSSDFYRGVVSNDESEQDATAAAFDLVHRVVAKRLGRGLLTVVDATNLRGESRRPLVELAHHASVPAVAIVFDLPLETCLERTRTRDDRHVEERVVASQREQLHKGIAALTAEGFDAAHVLHTADEVAAVRVERVPLPPDLRDELGPFDIIGDVHGCADEMETLLTQLGYGRAPDDTRMTWRHPEGRRVVFLGDLVDRGPRIADVLRTAMDMVDDGLAFAVPGNHDDKLLRYLLGRRVQVAHGLEDSIEQLARTSNDFVHRVRDFLSRLPTHVVLDDGRLVVAHAGMRERMQGRVGKRVRDFALFGDVTGKYDEHGLPVRGDWAAGYHGRAFVVFGHTPVAEPVWKNDTVNIDTGCVYGGALTALRWPEREVVSVKAVKEYARSRRAFLLVDANHDDG